MTIEGMFGMAGNRKGIIALKKKYKFRLFVADVHGYGTIGTTGTGVRQNL